MGAVEHLARLDDPARLPLAQIDERIAARPVDPGEAQDVSFGAPRPGRRRPARLVLEPGEAARGARQGRARLVDPFPRVIPINADGRIIDDAPERRRGGDGGREALDRRARATARRDRDDDRLGLPSARSSPGSASTPSKRQASTPSRRSAATASAVRAVPLASIQGSR